MIVARISSSGALIEGAGNKEVFPANLPAPETSQVEHTHLPTRQLYRLSPPPATYAPFRETFFHDATINPLLLGEGYEPDSLSSVRESKRLWSAQAPSLSSRAPRVSNCPGSAFQNQGTNTDRLYSTNRYTIGYDSHRSLYGTSLYSTTKRFNMKSQTPESVGPGSYNLTSPNIASPHRKPLPLPRSFNVSTVVMDNRSMDSAEEWKTTSEKPSPIQYTFQRAAKTTWIDKITKQPKESKSQCTNLPHFLQGTVIKHNI